MTPEKKQKYVNEAIAASGVAIVWAFVWANFAHFGNLPIIPGIAVICAALAAAVVANVELSE